MSDRQTVYLLEYEYKEGRRWLQVRGLYASEGDARELLRHYTDSRSARKVSVTALVVNPPHSTWKMPL